MHEMSIAQNIIEIVSQHLPKEDAHSVTAVNVKIGEMAGVVPDSLEFSFQVIAAETPGMGDAVLNMEFVPLIIRCQACGSESHPEEPVFICPVCNSVRVDIVSGTELQVTEIEIEDIRQEET
jgi:hydrogenase nickel incorporation protein HypA/HybF